ncbi:hypothetical protein N7478_001863 [Penicillium angulare]|uniref:uncharacterized protein n=1 Tax=Penicillium angulare TaxID=116970 RepID=UPI0025420829|nr:uncharacterized protein N7478_001863 [Penicillium angulare]KAJ5288833.1 hypothetical protein N7478_001863 [Penicillium angulare]
MILVDVLDRFGQGKKYFTPYEIQIAYLEWRHHLLQGKNPPSTLSRLVMGAVIHSSDSEDLKMQINDCLRSVNDIRILDAPSVAGTFEPTYGIWQVQVDKSPDSLMVRFSNDRTARLTKLLPDDEKDEEENEYPPDEIPDCVLREIMERNQPDEKKELPEVFNLQGGPHIGRVRPPYWSVALATQPSGHRYLSDAVLDEILPFWKELLNGDSSRTVKYYMEKWQGLKSKFEAWMEKEKSKLQQKGIKDWPASYSKQPDNMGSPDDTSDVWLTIYEVKATNKPFQVLSRSKVIQTRDRSEQSPSPESAGSTHQPRDSEDQSASFSDTQPFSALRKPPLDQSSEVSEATLRAIQESLRSVIIEQHSRLAGIHSKIDKIDNGVEKKLHEFENRMRGSNSGWSHGRDRSSSPANGHSSSPSQQEGSSTSRNGQLFRR